MASRYYDGGEDAGEARKAKSRSAKGGARRKRGEAEEGAGEEGDGEAGQGAAKTDARKQQLRDERAKRRKAKKAAALDLGATTAELEAIVFGGGPWAPSKDDAAETVDRPELEADKDSADGAEEGSRPKKKRKKSQAAEEEPEDDEVVAPGQKTSAAWEDPDDAALTVNLKSRARMKRLQRSVKETTISGQEYEQRLRDDFVKLHGTAHWVEQAAKDADSDLSEDEEGEIIPTSKRLVADEAGGPLKPGEIHMTRLKDCDIEPGVDGEGPAVVQSLNFHPNSELLAVGSLDKRLRLYAVDGAENPQVSSYFFKKFPIVQALFSPSGDTVLLEGRKKGWLYGLDVKTGEPFRISPWTGRSYANYFGLTVGPNPADRPGLRCSQMYSVLADSGETLLCDLATNNVVRTLRMRTPGVVATFCPDHDTLFTADMEHNIYEWDLGSGRCKQRFLSTAKVNTLAMRRVSDRAPTAALAVGTSSGFVDVFDLSGPKVSPTPVHSVKNLTTTVTSLRYHPDGELMVAASKFKKDSLKLVHTGTGTVFSNWPKQTTPLHRVSALDLSKRGGVLAVGNERGKVLLWRLQHYEH